MQRSISKTLRLAAGIVTATTMLALSACTSSEPSPGASDAAGGSNDAADGGTVTVAGPYSTDSLDPHGTASAAAGTSLASQSIFSRLVLPETDGTIVGDLAKEWTSNDDATVWQFDLREDAEFSDGTPLTAADVVASFNRVATLAGPVAGNFGDITVANDDDHSVTFTAPTPEPALLGKLTLFFVTKADVDDDSFTTEPIGSGPYVVTSFTPSQTLELAPNENYYGTVPIVDELILRNIPEVSARLTALKTGEIQATWGIPDDQISALEGDTSLTVDTVPSTSVLTMWFNSSRPALASADARNAIWQAVDFESIITALYPNTGEPSKSTVAPSVLGFSEEDAKEYDPDAAKKALTDAGFDFSQEIQIQYSGDEYSQFIQAVASDLAEVGVNAVPTQKDSGVFLEDLLALNWDINFQALSTPTFDAATNVGRLYPCAAGRTGYCNPELDAVLAAAGATSDTAVREDNYAKANNIIWGDAVGMYPMSLKIAYAWSSKLQGFEPNPSFLPDLSTVSY